LQSKFFGIGDSSCRLCQQFGEYENLRHLFMDCQEPKILDARRNFIFDVYKAIQQYSDSELSVQRIQELLVLVLYDFACIILLKMMKLLSIEHICFFLLGGMMR